MAAQVIPLFGNTSCDVQEDWKTRCLSFVSELLEELLMGLAGTNGVAGTNGGERGRAKLRF